MKTCPIYTNMLAILMLVLSATTTQAQDANPPSGHSSGGGGGLVEITGASRQSVAKGLAYLASTQAEDGSWGSQGASDPGKYARHAGITAIACMAFMSDGHLPDRGPYGKTVAKALDFVLTSTTASGLIASDTSHGPMYGHGFAALMLGEVYGMTRDARVREALLKAVRLIVDSQNQEGGWRYNPGDFDADISVTICQVMALRSAKNAGIYVPEKTIEQAVEYVRRCQNPKDGGFRYMTSSGSSQFPRSAAGVATLYYAGVYDDEALESGLKYIENLADPIRSKGGHFFYGHYYAAQAMYLAGGKHWAGWFPRIRDELVASQLPDGSWASPSAGSPYATGMSLIVIQLPNRLLPIFQR